jgi:hypothetical protein
MHPLRSEVRPRPQCVGLSTYLTTKEEERQVKNLTFHGSCGKSWLQVGNQTGHCGGCHLTFSSGRAFDRHQRMEDGRSVCLSPLALEPPLVPRPDRRTGEPVWGGEGSPPVAEEADSGGQPEAEEG